MRTRHPSVSPGSLTAPTAAHYLPITQSKPQKLCPHLPVLLSWSQPPSLPPPHLLGFVFFIVAAPQQLSSQHLWALSPFYNDFMQGPPRSQPCTVSSCASGPERAHGNTGVISTNTNVCTAAQLAEVKESGWGEVVSFYFAKDKFSYDVIYSVAIPEHLCAKWELYTFSFSAMCYDGTITILSSFFKCSVLLLKLRCCMNAGWF